MHTRKDSHAYVHVHKHLLLKVSTNLHHHRTFTDQLFNQLKGAQTRFINLQKHKKPDINSNYETLMSCEPEFHASSNTCNFSS